MATKRHQQIVYKGIPIQFDEPAKAKAQKNPRFDVYRDHVQFWRWTLYAKNGEIVASGEGYTTEADAKRGVRAVIRAVTAIVGKELLAA